MSKYVMTGHIDYDVDIMVHGKIASDIYDTLAGVEEMFIKYRMSDYGSAENCPKVIIHAPLQERTCFDPISVLGFYYRATHPRIFSVRDSLIKRGIWMSDNTNETMRMFGGRKVTYNVRPLHVLSSDGSFEYKLGSPLPPSMVNNLLTTWQTYLKVWSSVGDHNINWINSPRRMNYVFDNTRTNDPAPWYHGPGAELGLAY